MLDVETVKEMFSITSDEAITLLQNYKWNFARISDKFENISKFRVDIGIEFDEYSSHKSHNGGYCLSCYEEFNPTTVQEDSLICGHQFCGKCWKDYLT